MRRIIVVVAGFVIGNRIGIAFLVVVLILLWFVFVKGKRSMDNYYIQSSYLWKRWCVEVQFVVNKR